jgi:hypothetical protein
MPTINLYLPDELYNKLASKKPKNKTVPQYVSELLAKLLEVNE